MNRREAIIALCSGLLGTAFGMHFALWLKQFLSRRPPAPQNLRLKDLRFNSDILAHCPKCGHLWLKDYGITVTRCLQCGYVKPIYKGPRPLRRVNSWVRYTLHYDRVTVVAVTDVDNNVLWSTTVDKTIDELFYPDVEWAKSFRGDLNPLSPCGARALGIVPIGRNV